MQMKQADTFIDDDDVDGSLASAVSQSSGKSAGMSTSNTGMNGKGGESSTSEEELAKKESRHVFGTKLLVLLTLVCAAVAITLVSLIEVKWSD